MITPRMVVALLGDCARRDTCGRHERAAGGCADECSS